MKLVECSDTMRVALPAQLAKYVTDSDKVLRRIACKIAVIGQVKAGKSSFINALTQKPGLLPTHVNPWTTAVTHLHFGLQNAPEGVATRFTFFGTDEWSRLISGGGPVRELTARFVPGFEVDLLQHHVNAMRKRSEERFGGRLPELLGTVHEFATLEPDQLTEYICADNIEGAVDATFRAGMYSDIVKKADLFLPERTFSFPTTIIDTPGTNDPFMVRDEITRQALDSADIHIVVLTARQALSTADVALLRILDGLNKERVVVFINRIDELGNVGEDVEQIVGDVRRRLAKEFPQTEMQIGAGSANWAQRACSGEPFDAASPAGRKLMAYASHLGLSPAVGLPSAGGAAIGSWFSHCSGMPKLNRAISNMMQHSHAAHVMNQLAATFRELSRISPPIFLREIDNLAAEGEKENVRIDVAGVELREIENEVRDNEHSLLSVHGLQVDIQARTTQIIEDERAVIQDELRDAVDAFARSECAAVWKMVNDDGQRRTWTSRPGDLRRVLETRYLEGLKAADERLTALETFMVEKMQAAIGKIPTDTVSYSAGASGSLSNVLPFGALRRTIALDLGDPWWKRWWSGARSASERVAELDRLIRQEFDPIVEDLTEAAQTQLLSRQTIVLTRITMLSLSLIEVLQELSETRYQRLRKLMSERDEKQILERSRQRERRTAELRAHIEALHAIGRDLEEVSSTTGAAAD